MVEQRAASESIASSAALAATEAHKVFDSMAEMRAAAAMHDNQAEKLKGVAESHRRDAERLAHSIAQFIGEVRAA